MFTQYQYCVYPNILYRLLAGFMAQTMKQLQERYPVDTHGIGREMEYSLPQLRELV